VAIITSCVLFLVSAKAEVESHHKSGREGTFAVSQRAQEEFGYSSGFFITDLTYAGLITPQVELGFRFRILTSYGPTTVLNFARSGNVSNTGNQAQPTGFDRPLIRARQLIYGDFSNGRWFIMELGLALFNVTEFTPEYYRYWSGRIALHELLNYEIFNAYFELGIGVRSLTQFKQPENVGLIYPPTIDALAGIEKDLFGLHVATDFRLEQALTETAVAGSFLTANNRPYGATTRLFWAMEFGYRFAKEAHGIFIRAANRIMRWPDDDNAALWSTFEEASLGRSIELQWRYEW
jgi:hypothetical protein